MVDLKTITQLERGIIDIPWEFPENLSVPSSVLGAAITGIIDNRTTGEAYTITGTLTGTAAELAKWALSETDSGTPGTLHIILKAVVSGVATYTLAAQLIVQPHPSASIVPAAPLVAIPQTDADWLAAAALGGNLGTAAYADTADFASAADIANKQDKDTDAVTGNAAMFDASGNTIDAGGALGTAAYEDATAFATATALTDHINDTTAAHDDSAIAAAANATNYTPAAANVEAHLAAIDTALGSAGGGGDFFADGSVPMTGGIDYAGNSPLLNFTPSADLDHTFMEYAPQITPTLKWKWNISGGIAFPGDITRDDVTFNWGYNQGVQGGRANTGDGSFYLQLENHYWPSGYPDAQYEYHLTAVSRDGATTFRPFQINVRKDLSYVAQSFLADTFLWTNRAGTNLFGFTTGDKVVSYLPLDVRGTITATTQITLQTTGSTTPILSIAPGSAVIDFTGNPTTTDVRFYNWRKFIASGLTEFSITATNQYFYGDMYAIRSAAGTNTPARVFTAWRTLSSGTAADGIGALFDFLVQTSGGSSTAAGRVRGAWAVATTGAQIGEVALEAYDYNSTSVARTGMVVRASAAGEPLIAFYQGVTPVARQVLATGTGVTTDQLLAGLQALGLFKQS